MVSWWGSLLPPLLPIVCAQHSSQCDSSQSPSPISSLISSSSALYSPTPDQPAPAALASLLFSADPRLLIPWALRTCCFLCLACSFPVYLPNLQSSLLQDTDQVSSFEWGLLWPPFQTLQPTLQHPRNPNFYFSPALTTLRQYFTFSLITCSPEGIWSVSFTDLSTLSRMEPDSE